MAAMLPCHRVHDPRDRRQRVRRQPHRPGPARRRSSGRRAGPDAGRPARPSSAACRPAQRAAVEVRDRRRHPAGDPRAGAGRRRRRRPPRGDPARFQRRRGPAPGSTPRGPARSSPRCRRPASGASSTWARSASPTIRGLHYASSKARAEAAVRESGLDWTILKPSLQFGAGDGFFNIVAGLVRLSPGIVPVPGDGKSRFQPILVGDVAAIVVRSLADPATIGGTFELGGPRYWTYREITRGGPAGARQASRDRADAGPAHPPRGRYGRARPPARSRSPPTSSASCASTTSVRST